MPGVCTIQDYLQSYTEIKQAIIYATNELIAQGRTARRVMEEGWGKSNKKIMLGKVTEKKKKKKNRAKKK